MFQIILADPQNSANNPFKINFNVIYVPPAPSGTIFIAWLCEDNDIGL